MTERDWEALEDRLQGEALAAGDPTGWFDRLYAAGDRGEVTMPWGRTAPHPLLVGSGLPPAADGRRAVVVGCGLGADAEYMAGLGYTTTAFDVSPTAVRVAASRHPGSPVAYLAADLLALPADWDSAFDLVVEIITVQALPRSLRAQATAAVRSLVAPGGTLLVVAAPYDPAQPDTGPPWALTRAEVDAFAAGDVRAVAVGQRPDTRSGDLRWVATFRRA